MICEPTTRSFPSPPLAEGREANPERVLCRKIFEENKGKRFLSLVRCRFHYDEETVPFFQHTKLWKIFYQARCAEADRYHLPGQLDDMFRIRPIEKVRVVDRSVRPVGGYGVPFHDPLDLWFAVDNITIGFERDIDNGEMEMIDDLLSDPGPAASRRTSSSRPARAPYPRHGRSVAPLTLAGTCARVNGCSGLFGSRLIFARVFLIRSRKS
jgi:hypothetical protein